MIALEGNALFASMSWSYDQFEKNAEGLVLWQWHLSKTFLLPCVCNSEKIEKIDKKFHKTCCDTSEMQDFNFSLRNNIFLLEIILHISNLKSHWYLYLNIGSWRQLQKKVLFGKKIQSFASLYQCRTIGGLKSCSISQAGKYSLLFAWIYSAKLSKNH